MDIPTSPMTPEEALSLKGQDDDFRAIVQIWNKCLLASNSLHSGSVIVTEMEFEKLYVETFNDSKWIAAWNSGAHSLFADYGWTVAMDNPGYNETYKSSCRFVRRLD